MSFSILATILIAAYVAASVLYVYRWRGYARYPSFSQYLRKSWPVFAPFNCLLYLTTRAYARRPVLDAMQVDGMGMVRRHWAQIRDEAVALHAAGELDATTRPGSAGYYDVGFRTFYKRGWKKFYLKWYGEPHPSARRLCPQTVRIIEQVPGIRAAMFSVLPAGSELRLHSDPMACSLRYHLGLDTPESDRCFINVDGIELSWRNGQDFVFDETYPHYAVNATQRPRLILMCDVDRPMNAAGRAFNRMYSVMVKAMAVPNTMEDERGLFSRIFSAIAPWRAIAATVKRQHRTAYVWLKVASNTALVLVAFALIYLVLDSMARTGAAAIH
jgi:beta-hydroxylase